MRSMKKCFERVLVVLIAIACVLCSVSCDNGDKKGHTHSYTKNVTDPTCTANGHARYTCDCGDAYEEVLEALGHAYKVTYEYPTVTTDSTRLYVCERCGATETSTIHAISAKLPKASELLAAIIGSASYSIAIEEDSKFVYVTELSDYENGKTGVKGFVYFELAEAMINGKGEELVAHLGIKIGMTQTALTGLVPAKDVVASDNQEIAQVYFYVNGDDVSLEVISPDGTSNKLSENLSQMLYDAIGKMIGLDYETIAELSYIASELVSMMPVVDKVIDAAVSGLPTVSPAYVEHLATLVALVGENVVVESTDANGNTVYTVDPTALKLFLEEIENKTVSQYLASVYGEDVVRLFVDFLKALPTKTVKEIANSAVALVEATDMSLADIYTLIDLCIYFATDVEFCIENEIFSRYNMTLIEVLAELNGIGPDEIGDFSAYLNASFENIAQMLGTVTIDDMLSSLIYSSGDANISFIADIKATLDMIGEAAAFVLTVDANGVLVSAVVAFGAYNFRYEFDGTETTLTIVSGSREIVVTETATGVGFVVKEKGVQIATGSATATETTVGNDVVKTAAIDLRDSQNDLLDCQIVWTNDVITAVDYAIRGYHVQSNVKYDEGKDEWVEETVITFATRLEVKYLDDGNGSKTFKLGVDGVVYNLAYVDGNGKLAASVSAVKGNTTLASAEFAIEEVVVGNDTTLTVTADMCDAQNDLLDFTIVSVNGKVTALNVAPGGYITRYNYVYDSELEEYVKVSGELFVTYFKIDYLDNGNGNRSFEMSFDDVTYTVMRTEADGTVTFTLNGTEGNDPTVAGELIISEVTVDDVTTVTITADLCDDQNDYLDLTFVSVNGTVTTLNFVPRGFLRYTDWIFNPDTGKYEDVLVEEFITLMDLNYSNDLNGTKNVALTYAGMTLLLDIVKTDDVLTVNFNSLEGDEESASGTLVVTKTTVENDTTVTVTADLRDYQNDLLDCTIVAVNDEVTTVDLNLRAYVTTYEDVFDEDTKEWISTPVETTFEEVLAIDYDNDCNGTQTVVVTYVGNVTSLKIVETKEGLTVTYTHAENGVTVATGKYAVTMVTVGEDTTLTLIYEEGDGENDLIKSSFVFVNGELNAASVIRKIYEYRVSDQNTPPVREIVTVFDLQFKDNGDGTKDCVIKDGESVLVVETAKTAEAAELVFALTYKDEPIATGKITKTDKTLAVVFNDAENKLFDLYLELNDKKDALVKANVEINEYDYVWDEKTQEDIKIFGTLLQAGFEIVDNATGKDSVRIEYMGVAFVFGYEKTADGFVFTVTDGEATNTYLSYSVIEKDGAVTVDVFAGMPGMTLVDGAVTFAQTVEDEALVIVIDADIDHLLVNGGTGYDVQKDPNNGKDIGTRYSFFDYIEFDGAIKITVA